MRPGSHHPVRPRSALDSAAHLVATVGGLGTFPRGPGTLGSVVGVGVYLATGRHATVGLVAGGLLVWLGMWAAHRVEICSGDHDPSRVIIDEVAGQFGTLWLASVLGALPIAGEPMAPSHWVGVGLGFVFFRIADIFKPPPVRWMERLKGGVGVMADDLMAAVYAGLALVLVSAYRGH